MLDRSEGRNYKNWERIAAEEDKAFRNYLTLIDLSTDNGRKLIQIFPEYFSETEQIGPIPISVVCPGGLKEDPTPVTSGFFPKDFPLIGYNNQGKCIRGIDGRELSEDLLTEINMGVMKQGQKLDINGKSLVLVESNNKGEVWFALSEMVILD